MIIDCPNCSAEQEAECFSQENVCTECKSVYDMDHDCGWNPDTDDDNCINYPTLVRKAPVDE